MSQNQSTGLSINSSALISAERWGGGEEEIDSQRDTCKWSQLGFQLQPDLCIAKRGLPNLYNYFVTGKDE